MLLKSYSLNLLGNYDLNLVFHFFLHLQCPQIFCPVVSLSLSSKSSFLNPSQQESVVIKCEPDFSIVECKSPGEQKFSSHTQINSPEIRKTNTVTSNIMKDMKFPPSSALPNSTRSFNKLEKQNNDHLSKGEIALEYIYIYIF